MSLDTFGFDPGETFIHAAVVGRSLDNIFDPVLDYLDGLRWDGKERVDTWLQDYCQAADTPYDRAVGRKMLLAAVRRVRKPGCKFDFIVVLEGKQGILKSSLLRVLAGEENFSDAEILGTRKQEQQELIQGVWIYEIGELENMYRTDVAKIKHFASKQVDSARPAYGRHRVDRPRRCIFVGTTNDDYTPSA
jgi:predicted P-loop ATPase